jgi:hypothetical protein
MFTLFRGFSESVIKHDEERRVVINNAFFNGW